MPCGTATFSTCTCKMLVSTAGGDQRRLPVSCRENTCPTFRLTVAPESLLPSTCTGDESPLRPAVVGAAGTVAGNWGTGVVTARLGAPLHPAMVAVSASST